MTRSIRIGTRGSALALVQTRLVAAALGAAGVPNELVIIETEGDRRPPDTAWGEGAFVATIERALLDGRIDVAVHSAKDIPTHEDPRLHIAAFLPRADARDALVMRTGLATVDLASLPAGSRVGTDSPRRTGFILAARPDIVMVSIHGNVDTRLRRLDDGAAEALILAAAGLERLGRGERITQRLPPEVCPPAAGQGALAIQVRSNDAATAGLVAALDHSATRDAVELERAVLRTLGGGCRSPIGVLAVIRSDRVELIGGVAAPDGSSVRVERLIRSSGAFAGLVEDLAARLTAGARRSRRPRVLVTRPADSADRLVEALADVGITAVSVPSIATQPLLAGDPLDQAVSDAAGRDRIVVTSPMGAAAVLAAMARLGLDPAGSRWVAIGPTSAAVLAAGGAREVWVPAIARSAGIIAELPIEPGERLLLARGDLADERLPEGLRERGATVDEVVAYRTIEAPASSAALLEDVLDAGDFDAVLFASGSAVRGILRLAGDLDGPIRATPAICLGPETASVALSHGFRVIGDAPMQSVGSLAALTASLLIHTDHGVLT